jgi:Secretion system C-terminal sorting domain
MKKLYPLALAAIFFTLTTSAQTGGTYTAILPGNWHAASGPGIWSGAEPPSNCNNCLISLNVNGTVTLNASVTLTGGSTLIVGGGGASTTLLIQNSGATGFANSFAVMLTPTGGTNTIQLVDNTDFLNAAGAGAYDGVLQATPNGDGTTDYLKEYGNSPLAFRDNTVTNTGNAAYGTTQLGAATLNGFGTLPIILSAFTATLDGSQVDLAWTTDLEINSDHFAIQRSTDAGGTWTSLGTVAAAGNSNLALNYTYADTKPGQGTNEYRLQLVDKDGNYKYSTVLSVRLGLVTAVSVYPNPAHDYVNITLGGNSNENMLIRLFNQSGQILQERNISNAGGTTVPLAVGSYPEGSYIIVVTGADGSRQINKLLITK